MLSKEDSNQISDVARTHLAKENMVPRGSSLVYLEKGKSVYGISLLEKDIPFAVSNYESP